MKRKIFCVISAALIFAMTSVSVFGATSDIFINVNGIFQPIKTGIVNKNGSNLVGIREISEILEADDIFWNSNIRMLTIKKDGKEVKLSPDTGKVTVNGQEIDSTVSAEIIDNYVFVPLRFVSEIFDADVKWDENKKTISITFDKENDYVVLKTDYSISKDTKVYTYDEAIDAAVKKNSDLKNLDDTIAYLNESRDEMEQNMKLMDDAYASYMTLANGANGSGISDSTALQLRITETIGTTISIMQGMKAADMNKSLKGINEEMIKDSIDLTLKNYLSSIKTTQMNISLLEENVKLGQENIDNLELKLSVGMESEQNITMAKLEQKELLSSLESAKLSLEKLKQSLKSFIGVDADEDIVVDYEISFDRLKDIKLESYIAQKKQNDPSIKSLEAQVEIAKYNERIAVNASDAERINLVNTMNTASRNLKDSQDKMETNIRNSYNSLKQLEEQDKAKKLAVQRAIETYNSAVVSYQAGMTTAYQVSQAKMGILNAEMAVEQNAIDYDMLVFTFERPYMLSGN